MQSRAEATPDRILDSFEEKEILCQDSLENDVAKVTIKLGTSVVTTTVKSRKTSFPEQLATFGGTIGLFTGMSFLSAFEILVWIKRIIFRPCQIAKQSSNP